MRANDTPPGVADVPQVDVVVPLFRPGRWLEPCVESIRASAGVRARPILVDDSPDDPAVAAFASAAHDVRLVRMPRNAGFAAAANAGMAAGAFPYVLLLNQDASITPDYIARLVARLEEDPRLASIAGKLLHLDDDGSPDGLIDSCGLHMRRGRRAVDIGQGETDLGQHDAHREVFGVSAAAALYRRAALEQVALDGAVFDPRFFMYKEDVDLAWRLRAAGWTAWVDTEAVAFHARGAERAPDATRGAAVRPLGVLRQERSKSRRVRELAWRNQLLMLIRNEDSADLARSFTDLVLMQLAYASAGLLVDPVGTVAVRLTSLGPIVEAFRTRRAWRRSRTTRLSRWLP
jgi:GT2 family glycosyltransferase